MPDTKEVKKVWVTVTDRYRIITFVNENEKGANGETVKHGEKKEIELTDKVQKAIMDKVLCRTSPPQEEQTTPASKAQTKKPAKK